MEETLANAGSLIAFLFFLVVSSLVLGANNVRLQPSAGMPTVTIAGLQAVDISQLQAGDLISFDLIFENVDFEFAGCEFIVFGPPQLCKFSESDSDWASGLGGVFKPGGVLLNKEILVLPVDAAGATSADTVNNAFTKVRTGFLFTDPTDRWKGSPSQPFPGGVIGTISLVYNPNGGTYCTSYLESIQVLLTPNYIKGTEDYFSDGAGSRVAVVSALEADHHGRLYGKPAYLGDPSMHILADANLDGTRNSIDLLAIANCAVLGRSSAGCVYNGGPWTSLPEADFYQTFNFDCSNGASPVGATDALGLILLAYGLRDQGDLFPTRNRFSGPSADRDTAGKVLLEMDAHSASMVWVTLFAEGISFAEPFLANPGLEQANPNWVLKTESRSGFLDLILVRRHGKPSNPGQIVIPFMATNQRPFLGVIRALGMRDERAPEEMPVTLDVQIQ